MKEARLTKVRALMAERGLRQLVVTAPQNIWYLTGQWVMPMDRLDALVIGETDCRLLCYVLAQAYAEDCETIVYRDYGQTVEELSRLLSAAVTGVDGALEARFLLPLLNRRTDIAFRVSDCVERARAVKDAEEAALLRRASRVTDDVFADAFARVREGMTERQLGQTFSEAFERADVGPFEGTPMCAFGEGAAEPHHHTSERRLRPGDAILVDTGKRIDGYYSDTTRTAFFREATAEQRKVYDVVLRANEAALRACAPGVPIAEIDRAARDVIEAAGYGAYFTHRASHGLGIDFHEEPFDRGGETLPVLPGMCFSVEPGVYLPGRFGVRIEDAVLMTESGAEVLTQAPKALTVLG